MLKLVDGIVELFKKVATSLPPDIETALIGGYNSEKEGSNAKNSLDIVLENIKLSRKNMTPLCQDTGVPIFFVYVPSGISQKEIKVSIYEATRKATDLIPLRPNAVDPLSGKNSGDNTGEGFPVIYMEETDRDTLRMDLLLKGSGSENIGMTYKLPDEGLNAQRDLDGVRKCVIDAVFRAQGRACPPYIIGVGIGATKDQVSVVSKKQLLRKLNDKNNIEEIDKLEYDLLSDINRLGIGPIGFGGLNTAIGVKIGVNHRHPASYFVDVSFGCWANRRGTLLW
jgi:fumarate hydratase class I